MAAKKGTRDASDGGVRVGAGGRGLSLKGQNKQEREGTRAGEAGRGELGLCLLCRPPPACRLWVKGLYAALKGNQQGPRAWEGTGVGQLGRAEPEEGKAVEEGGGPSGRTRGKWQFREG